MIERIKTLIRENNMCVLATCLDNKPHCSLMGYLADEKAETIYMVTRGETHKYRNMLQNPLVSLLIDTRREQGPESSAQVQALTIAGTCEPLHAESEKRTILERLLSQHPHLKELADHPDAAIIAVKLHSFLLLDGALTAHHVTGNE
jgi:nitroimidazol reductase NimA-like FMN-containing flavoprotein (pyridoxamine 5'-phosphate oxidase superfamily)